MEPVELDLRLGLWKIHILHHASFQDVWGTWLLDELARHGHRLSPGTLYPALSKMERIGWIERTSSGPHTRSRQSFRITPAGSRLLEALRHDVTELYQEVVLGALPAAQQGKDKELSK